MSSLSVNQESTILGMDKVLGNSMNTFKTRDPISALTHFCGFWLALLSMPPLIIKAAVNGATYLQLCGYAVFMLSMILLYGASTAYHTFILSNRAIKRLKKIDHCMIFVLIAGTYTPVCITALYDRGGMLLLAFVWSVAIMGIVFKLLWVTCPKWVSSVIYISLGWVIIFKARELCSVIDAKSFTWLLSGGIMYTIGGIIYAMKPNALMKRLKYFTAHDIFHIFCLIGSFCHFMMIYLYLTIY